MPVTITPTEVAAWGEIDDITAGSTREELLQTVIDGVTAKVDEMSIPWGDEDDTVRRENATKLGLLMLCHRVWTRRKSPDGNTGFSADLGVVRIMRTDPDVAAQLHPWLTEANPEP